MGGETGTAFSGEEYRQELRAGLENPITAEMVRSLAWGSGSGLSRPGARPGFVFCARVGDHPEPQFRFVPADAMDEPVGDTLSSLSYAHATADTPRLLTDEMHARAYDAWAAARQDIFDRWMAATDPANLQPQVPKAMRDAAEILRSHPPGDLTVEQLDEVLNAIEAPYGERILKRIRDAMTSTGEAIEQVAAIVEVVRDLGLEPAESPQPLPIIDESDIHLVCWTAITAESDG
jgi:hypothetical protein